MKTNSGASKRSPAAGRKARILRQNNSGASGLNDRISARKKLFDLKHWVKELNEKHGRSFRWIADHTTRGKNSHGYWQQIAVGAHLVKPRRIAPTEADYADMRLLIKIVRGYAERELAINEKLMAFQRALLETNLLALDVVELATKLGISKE